MTNPISNPVARNDDNTPSAESQVLGRIFKDRQFIVACALLGLAAAAWPFTISALQWAQIKTPVPWPNGVTVSDDFRWTNLPARLGKYVLEDNRTNKQDPGTKSDGEIVLPKEKRDILGVGRYEDAPRFSSRRSNWYVSRVYVDTTQPPNSPLRLWQLDVIYYTGAAEKVEHVPDRCMVTGGYKPSGDRGVSRFASDHVEKPWPNSLEFAWSGFVKTGMNPTPPGRQIVEYYTFILNGACETSWAKVRLHMATTPWEKHCYFAKIQFMPRGLITDVAVCDRAAQEFVNAFLPEVFNALPTSLEIIELNSGRTHNLKEAGKNNG